MLIEVVFWRSVLSEGPNNCSFLRRGKVVSLPKPLFKAELILCIILVPVVTFDSIPLTSLLGTVTGFVVTLDYLLLTCSIWSLYGAFLLHFFWWLLLWLTVVVEADGEPKSKKHMEERKIYWPHSISNSSGKNVALRQQYPSITQFKASTFHNPS